MDGEQLNQVLTDHSLWLSSNGKQGKRAGLSGANLTGVDLSGADLTRANLSWANLHRANLSWADLSGADLTRANLSWANLTGANLTGANLTGAYPRGANLTEVNLTDAYLHRADLTGAELGPQIRECLTFEGAQVSEDQLAWLCLHPLFGEWQDSLEVVPARDRNAHHVTLPGPGPSDARANPPRM